MSGYRGVRPLRCVALADGRTWAVADTNGCGKWRCAVWGADGAKVRYFADVRGAFAMLDELKGCIE